MRVFSCFSLIFPSSVHILRFLHLGPDGLRVAFPSHSWLASSPRSRLEGMRAIGAGQGLVQIARKFPCLDFDGE